MCRTIARVNATRGSPLSFSTYLREKDFPMPAMISLVRPWDADKTSETALWRFDISVKSIGRAFIKPVEERNDVIARWNPHYERSIRCVHPVKGKTARKSRDRDRYYRRFSQFPAESDNFLSATRSLHAARNFSHDRPTSWSNLRYGRELELKGQIPEAERSKSKHQKTKET